MMYPEEEFVVMKGPDILASFNDIEEAYQFIVANRLVGCNVLKPDPNRTARVKDATYAQNVLKKTGPQL